MDLNLDLKSIRRQDNNLNDLRKSNESDQYFASKLDLKEYLQTDNER